MQTIPPKSLTNRLTGVFTVVVMLLLGSALAVRFLVRDFTSADYLIYTSRWYRLIQLNGGLLALHLPFSNYTAPYLYLLAIGNFVLPFAYSLHAIKLISVLFDLLCAFAAFRIIITATGSMRRAWAGCLVVLLCPTVVTNSAVWGQADAIYTAFLILTIWRLMKRDGVGGLFLYSIAFAFKLQAIFLLPLYLYLALDRQLRFRDLLIIPAVFLGTSIPAVLAGRPWLDVLGVYLNQASNDVELTNHATTIYQWLPSQPSGILGMVGIAAAGLFVVGYYWLLRRAHISIIDRVQLVAMTLLLVIPFLLPHMHDRYFYPADVLAIVIAFTNRRLWWLPIPIVAASFMAYLAFLANYYTLPLGIGSMLILLAIFGLLWVTFSNTHKNAEANRAANSSATPIKSISLRGIWIFGLTSILLFCVAIPIGQGVGTKMDQSSVAAVFTFNTVHIQLRSPQAIRCNNSIRVEMTWTDTQGAIELQGAHLFLHALDQNQTVVAQGDGPTQPYPLLLTPFAERREVLTSDPASVQQIKLGLYQFDSMSRYRAQKFDGTLLPDNALSIPVVEGVCPVW